MTKKEYIKAIAKSIAHEGCLTYAEALALNEGPGWTVEAATSVTSWRRIEGIRCTPEELASAMCLAEDYR